MTAPTRNQPGDQAHAEEQAPGFFGIAADYIRDHLRPIGYATAGVACIAGGLVAGHFIWSDRDSEEFPYDELLVPQAVETWNGYDLDDSSYVAKESVVWVKAFHDKEPNGVQDKGEESIYFGVREDRETGDALEQVAQRIANAAAISVKRPPGDPYMAGRYPGAGKILNRPVFDEDLVTGHSFNTAKGQTR